MDNDWTTVFQAVFDERPVEGLVYIEGDLLVKTVTKTDFDGIVFDGSFLPPRAAGSAIDIHASNKAQLRTDLIGDGEFSEDDADAIVASFGTRGR